MRSIKQLSGKELKNLVIQATSELEKRKRIEFLNKDIQKMLSKHNVTKVELEILIDTLKGTSKVSRSKARSVAKVPAKYKSPVGSETWTGRGRTPNWVTQLCVSRGISLVEFKQNSDYSV